MNKYNIKSFLPNDKPLQRLPDRYSQWEIIMDNLSYYNGVHEIRQKIDELPLFNTDFLNSIEQWRRAYVVLSFLVHSYVWSDGLENAIDHLRANIAIPFFEVSKKLGLPPVLTHSAVDLWNWKLKDEDGPIVLENLELVSSFTGSQSESTFYLVMTEIEAYGSEIISDLTMLPSYIASNDVNKIRSTMNKFNTVMKKIIGSLSKMYLTCEPNIFYNVLRKFLNGWGSGNIKNGLIFDTVQNEPIICNGGSAAQSSLIQLFDVVFDVKHTSSSTSAFLTKMRTYMPNEHREFLIEIEKDMNRFSLSKYISRLCNNDLTELFDRCIESLKQFRSSHMALVHTYILKIMPKDIESNNNSKAKGTGGTDLVTFLKTCKDETDRTKITKKLNYAKLEVLDIISTDKLPEMSSKQPKDMKLIDKDTDESIMEDKPVSKSETIVTPWVVEGDIDYMKLVNQFGTELIDSNLMTKFEKVTGKPLHPWIKRCIFFSHRSLNKLLDAYENGEPVFLYTGRGPTSDSMHLGHLIPFMFTKWLQDVFDCPLVIQIADDEKYYFKQLEFTDVYRLGFENAKDIIACGFNPKKTYIFSNRDYRLNVPAFEEFVSIMKKNISAKQVAKVFGFGERIELKTENGEVEEHYTFNDNVTVGMMDWPFYQSAAAFSQAFPHIFNGRPAHCLVGYAIDQDPYFRMARDLADKMNLLKPCSIMCTFIPPLTGSAGKMSSSVGTDATLFLTDDQETLRRKIMTHAFSGGGGDGTLADHIKYGGNTNVDISYQYLKYFEFDDEVLAKLKQGFEAGEITCSQMKATMANKIIKLFEEHQMRRKLVTDDDVKEFYSRKQMDLPIQKFNLTDQEKQLYQVFDQLKINYHTFYHPPITTMEQGTEIAKKLKGAIGKNLLLRGKDDMFYLYVTGMNTVVNMKTLPKKLKVQKLKFAEKHFLQDLLNVPVGCATIFGIMNSVGKNLTVVFDETIKTTDCVNFHPLRNDATTTISYSDMLVFLDHYNCKPIYIVADDSLSTES